MDATDGFAHAEKAAFDRYGLDPVERLLDLSEPPLRIRVLEHGDGPAVVLVPGDGAVAAAWAPLVAELPGYRSIVVDRPGFGRSSTFDYRGADLRRHGVAVLRGVLDGLALQKAAVVGSSGGGEWSLWLALDAPDRVSALAPMGIPAVCLPGFRADTPMKLLSLPGIGRALFAIPSPSAKATGKQLASSDARLPEHPEIVAVYHEARRLPGYGSAAAAIFRRSMQPGGAPRDEMILSDADLERIAQPTLFVWGADEPYGSPEVARRAARLMPDARVEVIANGWHHPWLADAPRVGSLLRDFLG